MSTKPDVKLRPQDVLSAQEIAQFTQRSDWMGWWAVLSTWAVIAGILYIFIYSLEHAAIGVSVVVGLLALVILAGRQLCLGILTHEAAHSTLFASRKLNDWVGDWLCAKPVWNSLHDYRPYHLQHHAHTSTDLDPDLSLVAGLPTTRVSLSRKFARDLVGITGIKFVIGRILMDLGIFKWSVTNRVERLPQAGRAWWDYPLCLIRNSYGMLLTNGLMLSLLWWAGHPLVYGLWVLAYITPFPLFIRLRSMAEHGGRESSASVLINTRTTQAGWLARATVAPIHVNYHIEHHLMAGVPYFRLPALHQLLLERGVVATAPSYRQVILALSSLKQSNII